MVILLFSDSPNTIQLKHSKVDLVGFEPGFSFHSSAATLDKDKKSSNLESCQGAEVVGSNPTRSTFINLVNYGINDFI